MNPLGHETVRAPRAVPRVVAAGYHLPEPPRAPVAGAAVRDESEDRKIPATTGRE